MSTKRKGAIVLGATMLVLFLGISGCVVPGDGYGDVGVSYGVNYYEPFDNNGWWGPGYLVGPSRGDRAWHDDRRTHAWHAGPGSRNSLPSLPHGRPGGGGGHSGGGGGGRSGGGGGGHDGRH